MLLEVSDLIIFFGRFHPLVVHLPIGFLLLAIIIALASKSEKYKALAPALDFILLLGAVSAALACILGFMLSQGGGYDPDSLFWHQWMGISLAVLSFVLYWIGAKKIIIPKYLYQNRQFAFWGLLLVLAITGHLGGNLTHGSGYLLQYAPDPLRVLAGLEPKATPRPPVAVLDSADIFLDVVHPIIQSKCQSCHNPDKKKGELLLTNYEEMLKGGEEGPSVVPGDLNKSLLYQRVTLPETHDDYMPAEGKPGLDDDEIALLQWWIENDAPPTMQLADMKIESNLEAKFERVLGISTSGSRLPENEVAAADSVALNRAVDEGFIIKQIVPGSNFLEVRLPFTGQSLNDMDVSVLLPLKDQIVWMDFSQGEVGDEDLAIISQMKPISRLNLSNNPISDKGVAHLKNLTEIQYLNLYGTQVSDAGLDTLKALEKLQSLYLWQTQVTDSGVASFKKERPQIAVTLGQVDLKEEREKDSSEISS
jgi:uncharacterized membrane protein/mono/diheme cytochrome c family protein